MPKFNTGNPLGSSDPRDLFDNAAVADKLVTGDKPAYGDRLGKSRKSWQGMEDEFAAFIAASGYEFVGDYAAGIEITGYNQVVRDTAGEFWRVSGTTNLPYTTTGSGMPEGGAFVSAGDAVLRQDLAAENGADLIGFNGGTLREKVNSISDYIEGLEKVSANAYGASPSVDYETNRAAIQAANDYLASVGGGTVTIDPGVYEVKGIIQDSRVVFSIPGVILKSPDGLAPSVISTRITDLICSSTAGSGDFVVTGDLSGVEVGVRVAVRYAGGMLDSQKTTLTSTVSGTDTLIGLTDATGLPDSGVLRIGNELISYSALSGDSVTVSERGAFGTTAASHDAGAAIGFAKRLYGTVMAVNGSTVTLDRESDLSFSGGQFSHGTIGQGLLGLPVIDVNKVNTGAPSSVHGYVGQLCSLGTYDFKVYRGDVGGVFFAKGAAYNYCRRLYMHDCGIIDGGGRGSALWLFASCENNHFDFVEVTGDAWVGVYLDDRTTTASDWDGPNNNNTFVQTNINVTRSGSAPLNIVSGRHNRFLGGKIKAPEAGLSISDNSQGSSSGTKSYGNSVSNFNIDVLETPWILESSGNSLTNIFCEQAARFIENGENALDNIARSAGASLVKSKPHRINILTKTRFTDFTGWEIPAVAGTGSAGGVIDLSDTVSEFNPIIYNNDLKAGLGNRSYAAAMDVSVPTGYPSISLRVSILAYSSTGPSPEFSGSSAGGTVTIEAGETKRLSANFIATPHDTVGLRLQLQMRSSAMSGRRIVIEPKPFIEEDAYKIGDLFDGDSGRALWLGPENDSQSIIYD
tara:strand:+ start:67 stop:2469 length:2403 start_codon:yes stop_codon:yes gene_type:complete